MVKTLSDLFLNQDILDSAGLNYISLPAFYANYDFSVNEWFSMGVAASYQMFRMEDEATSEFTRVDRTNIGFRTLFHYGQSDVLDMYSGVRFGTTFWNVEASFAEDDPAADLAISEVENWANNFRIVPQIVAFGIKGYFTDNFGGHLEISIGAPYYLSGGFTVRF
jgi:hypothetical protein